MKKYFITGAVILLPLALTIAIVAIIVDLLTGPFLGVAENFLTKYEIFQNGIFFIRGERVLRYTSQAIILVGITIFTILLGVLTRWFMVKTVLNISDFIIHRIPIINSLYKLFQDVFRTIFTSNADSFKQVVMVPFPNKRTYSLGLVTRKAPPSFSKKTHDDLVSVFVPTTPNPTSGYLLMFPRKDLIDVDGPVEDAIKFIISCGVIHPEFGNVPDIHNDDDETEDVNTEKDHSLH